jgi:hypothetical protein
MHQNETTGKSEWDQFGRDCDSKVETETNNGGNTMLNGRILTRIPVTILLVITVLTGCSQQSSLEPEVSGNAPGSENTMTDEEVAISIAALIAEDNGGSLDQIGDALELATVESVSRSAALGKSADPSWLDFREAVWDSVSQTWTIHVERERGNPDGEFYAEFIRDKTVQFLGADGTPQKRWFWEGDTARSILVSIESGEGRVIRPRLSHTLKSIDGEFEVTETHTDTVTLNGTLNRAALDTVITKRGKRISDHGVSLTFVDVVGPRGSRRDLTQKVSGFLTGTYSASVMIETESGTITKEITHEIDVELGVDEFVLKIGGKRFRAHAGSGELIEDDEG